MVNTHVERSQAAREFMEIFLSREEPRRSSLPPALSFYR
jgi:hypothetical protein